MDKKLMTCSESWKWEYAWLMDYPKMDLQTTLPKTQIYLYSTIWWRKYHRINLWRGWWHADPTIGISPCFFSCKIIFIMVQKEKHSHHRLIIWCYSGTLWICLQFMLLRIKSPLKMWRASWEYSMLPRIGPTDICIWMDDKRRRATLSSGQICLGHIKEISYWHYHNSHERRRQQNIG